VEFHRIGFERFDIENVEFLGKLAIAEFSTEEIARIRL
jgi:hypothetical protein